jgi:hypothetical protein
MEANDPSIPSTSCCHLAVSPLQQLAQLATPQWPRRKYLALDLSSVGPAAEDDPIREPTAHTSILLV